MGKDKELTNDRSNADSSADLLGQAYARLRRIAARIMQSERAGHTLWPTEVVHEALARQLQASDGGMANPEGEADLVEMITYLSRGMRQVLVDHARRHKAVKRGGGRGRVSLDQIGDIEAAIETPGFDWLRLDHALSELARHDPRRHQVVTLRFFGGLDNRQIAKQLKLDERTIGRDWAAARLWLKKQLQQQQPSDEQEE